MGPDDDALLVEACPLCGRDQTLMRTPTRELRPTCICCGGAGLARDRDCRHHGPQAALHLKPASPAP